MRLSSPDGDATRTGDALYETLRAKRSYAVGFTQAGYRSASSLPLYVRQIHTFTQQRQK
ncbi:hypothetical protein I8751_01755 [Nostocaceae cyanobacterium CENA357]|uniref:Uncharacterized protein n=1 Tax=Atlanticothrix silvestris CENA357 TaxID=1725252 RepID=A0A8J7H6N3_9CYAN|nr:hypothetical protein [Atlanticothrix silvestris CENA357]